MTTGGVMSTPIDPTKNVSDQLEAAVKRLDDLRKKDRELIRVELKAEMRRLRELAIQKEKYDARVETLLRVQVESTSNLLSTSLDKTTSILGTRITVLEQKSWETGGRGVGRTDIFGWIALGIVMAGGLMALLGKFTS